jgi:mannitol/fructose-specific phosphotransferase system IIA component (Ntr-type)
MISALRSHIWDSESSVATKALYVSDFLTEKSIVFFPAAQTKQAIFETLIGSMNLADPALALKEVLYRELWGRTVIAPGFALPHARIAGMKRIVAALGICPKGFADSSVTDKDKPYIFLLFLGPTNDVQQHLAFLASVSTLFQTKNLTERLLQMTTPASVFNQLRAAEASL